MLKLEDRLWIYSPTTDRIIQISGHLLRQSVMGSDLSYEDMMEERKLSLIYNCNIIGSEILDSRDTWKIELIAKNDDVSYFRRIIWIDKLRYVPLRYVLFAKSGQLLKTTIFSDVKKFRVFFKKILDKKIKYDIKNIFLLFQNQTERLF